MRRPVASVPAVAQVASYSDASLSTGRTDQGDLSVWGRLPVFTLVLAIGFFAVYRLQASYAFQTGPGGAFDLESLVSAGAVSYNLVFDKGEWWRLFLAPLLHSGLSHVTGNCVALLIAGFRLEPMLGRWWFLTTFCLSALGGVAGSLSGNPHAVVTVGASGGISGLLGALFVASFHHKAHELSDQAAMRRTALRFGVPALMPMLFNVHNGVDYYAHGAGAITGALIAIVLCGFWPGDEHRPRGSFVVLLVPVAYFSLSTIGLGYAARGYQSHARASVTQRTNYMPDSLLPKSMKLSERESTDLVSRYPKDPRAHLLRGYSLALTGRFGAAEYELRGALALFTPDLHFGGRDLTVALLAADLVAQHRASEARDVAAPLCATSDKTSDVDRLLAQTHVCDRPEH